MSIRLRNRKQLKVRQENKKIEVSESLLLNFSFNLPRSSSLHVVRRRYCFNFEEMVLLGQMKNFKKGFQIGLFAMHI